VLGLDHNRAAVAAVATLGRGEYHVGGEAEFGRALSAEAWDAVILDPPRTGARGIVEAMAQSRAQTIVYVSCDPATLARDVKGLVERGWSLTDTRVLDLFPHTAHIETVCRLVR
jgi:23S rRNA (uracil1939-C5)-methyltransferase